MNKKGQLLGAEIAVLSVAALALIGGILLTPAHRVRKAIEVCEQKEPAGTDCVAFAKYLQKSGQLSGTKPDYIRDK